MYLRGGTHLDFDVLSLGPIPEDKTNFVPVQNNRKVNNAVMRFDGGNRFLKELMQQAVSRGLRVYPQNGLRQMTSCMLCSRRGMDCLIGATSVRSSRPRWSISTAGWFETPRSPRVAATTAPSGWRSKRSPTRTSSSSRQCGSTESFSSRMRKVTGNLLGFCYSIETFSFLRTSQGDETSPCLRSPGRNPRRTCKASET